MSTRPRYSEAQRLNLTDNQVLGFTLLTKFQSESTPASLCNMLVFFIGFVQPNLRSWGLRMLGSSYSIHMSHLWGLEERTYRSAINMLHLWG
ncbi:hypothetical protein F4X33_10730 [Candidatus Poribacteria bacterium]|nr:hypothetical protein [Candidatus Poribacteria bacterium]